MNLELKKCRITSSGMKILALMDTPDTLRLLDVSSNFLEFKYVSKFLQKEASKNSNKRCQINFENNPRITPEQLLQLRMEDALI